MKLCVVFILVFATCSSFANPTEGNPLMLRSTFPAQILTNVRALIEQLIANLQTTASEAVTAIVAFETGLLQQATLIRERIATDLQSLKGRVNDSISAVLTKVTATSTAVQECIDEKNTNINTIFNNTQNAALECVEQRIADISTQIQNLKNTSNEVLAFSDSVVTAMQACVSESSVSLINTARCLGSVAFSGQATAVALIAKTAKQIGSLNLAIATVATSAELCAGVQLFNAGIETGRIMVQLGKCSAASVLTTFTGST